ncbi:hypothetical protein JY77_08665, partial [Neisseria meningitidis]|uniref:hypothetical protein n=1 Tax=Neisseria meningitidis TaxID=487 RepID=UPI000FEFBE56
PPCILDGFPLVPYVLAVFPASSFPLGIPDLAVVQLYFCGIFSRYFSDTAKDTVNFRLLQLGRIGRDCTVRKGDGRITISLKSLY